MPETMITISILNIYGIDPVQILLHLPDDLVRRFRATVPPRQRSSFIAKLLEKALPEQDDALYQLALEVEQDAQLNEGWTEWDAVVSDGLEIHG
jgi:hypothetical protein